MREAKFDDKLSHFQIRNAYDRKTKDREMCSTLSCMDRVVQTYYYIPTCK